METIQLVSFYQIVKTGSFSKASSLVFRSQSAVSHQIANLEKELNVKLFDRIGKKIRLTDEGEILFNVVDDFFNELEKLKSTYIDMHTGKGSSLTIASGSALITYFLPNVIKKFLDRCVKSKFKWINCGLTSQIVSRVSDGEVDFGIGPNMNYAHPPNMNYISWKSFDMVLLMAKAHPLSGKKVTSLNDIVPFPLILYREGTVVRRAVEGKLIESKLPYEIAMEMDGAETIKQYVEIGLGISVLTSLALTERDKDRFSLSVVSNIFGKIDYGLYYRKDKYITAAMKQFIECFDRGLLDNLLRLQKG
jgi:DNA-binding transcriptional LysR family regulator